MLTHLQIHKYINTDTCIYIGKFNEICKRMVDLQYNIYLIYSVPAGPDKINVLTDLFHAALQARSLYDFTQSPSSQQSPIETPIAKSCIQLTQNPFRNSAHAAHHNHNGEHLVRQIKFHPNDGEGSSLAHRPRKWLCTLIESPAVSRCKRRLLWRVSNRQTRQAHTFTAHRNTRSVFNPSRNAAKMRRH